MTRNITFHNPKLTHVDYEIKDDYLSPVEDNPTLATGSLDPDQSEAQTIDTHSDMEGNVPLNYRYFREDDQQWHTWTRAWTEAGVLEMQ